MKSASQRFTRMTLSFPSCTTIKSLMASKISIQCRLARSMLVNSRAFCKATDACPAAACRRFSSSRDKALSRLARQSTPT